MRRALVLATIALGTATAAPSWGAELDDAGKLRPVAAGARFLAFDDPAAFAALGAFTTVWKSNQLVTTPIVDDALFVGRALGGAEAIAGRRALRLGASIGDGATGVLIPGASLAKWVGSPRFEITLWAKGEGTTPLLTVGWSTRAPYGDELARVVAVRTGRETSDGWAELTTGPIDASIWDVPLSGVLIGLSSRAPSTASIAIGALEVVPVAGSGVAPVACTQADVDAVCGPEGDCQYGRCVPGYAAWGPLPPRAHREELVNRWIHLATRVQGDRRAAENAKALVSEGPPLAWYSVGSRPFFAGIKRLTNALRDHHTSFGGPTATLLYPIASGGGSATVGACFGPGRHDLLAKPGEEGALGFVVYRANESPPSGVVLKKGDALTAIDGAPPLAWIREVWGTHASALPNDPGADLGWAATGLAWLIEKRASTIEITRCKSATSCEGADCEVLVVDVAKPLFERIRGTGSIGALPGYFGCDIRFQEALTKFAPNVRGENTVSGEIVRGDVLAIHFDGTYGSEKWSPSMRALFPADAPPKKVLFDTRQGNGGYGFNAETVIDLIRAKTEPIGNLIAPVGAWDGASVSSIMTASKPCYDAPGSSYACLFTDTWFNAKPETIAADARVVFLNTADVSANDFLARLAKGRANQAIFAPCPTSGAFGSVSSIPSLLVGWGGGRIQMQDALFGPTWGSLAGASWESGKGVAPDVVVAQTMSDALLDRDTMIEAAHAFLAGAGGTP